MEKRIAEFQDKLSKIRQELRKAVVGHDEVLDQTLWCLIAGGHVLLQGAPGLGKTLLVRTLATCLNLSFSRIQFTPDLMPADIVGTNMAGETVSGKRGFEFYSGPVFANLVLADEINRATPKTQSALLEAMQEQKVTAGGETRPLPSPFFVMATQNPIEMEGTYPLPEAQLDRFMFMIYVQPSELKELMEIIDRTTGKPSTEAPQKVMDGKDLLSLRELSREVPLAQEIKEYAAKLVLMTAPDHRLSSPTAKRYLRYGASPRAAQSIILASKVRALTENRLNVSFEDVRATAIPALRHRIIRNFECEAEGISPDIIIRKILEEFAG